MQEQVSGLAHLIILNCVVRIRNFCLQYKTVPSGKRVKKIKKSVCCEEFLKLTLWGSCCGDEKWDKHLPVYATYRTLVAETIHTVLHTEQILVHFYVVVWSAFESSAHDATLTENWGRFTSSWRTESYLLNYMQHVLGKKLVSRNGSFSTKWTCDTLKPPCSMFPQHFPWCLPTEPYSSAACLHT